MMITGFQGYYQFMIVKAGHQQFALFSTIFYMFTETLVMFYFIGSGTAIKKEIFSHVLSQFSSWHDQVFFYLCMEERSIWESVFGKCYVDNTEFENALFNSVSSKMYSLESV